jgi:hypothetical protein
MIQRRLLEKIVKLMTNRKIEDRIVLKVSEFLSK